MAFDWVRFLDDNAIPYVTQGPNIGHGDVGIACPFCGDDPSEHLAISLTGRGWVCRRNRMQHKGKSPVRLVARLLGIANDAAYELVYGEGSAPPSGNLATLVRDKLWPGRVEVRRPAKLLLPDNFRRMGTRLSARPYWRYLTGEDRQMSGPEARWVVKKYDLRYCTGGPYHGRVIFPIRFEGRLHTWTGRAITDVALIRYRTLSTDDEVVAREGLGPALCSITDLLLSYDVLIEGGSHLVVVEGPFDAVRLSWLGRKRGLRATCLFTQNITSAQIDLLSRIASRYEHRSVLLDAAALGAAVRVCSALAGLGFGLKRLPARTKDPALLEHRAFEQIFF